MGKTPVVVQVLALVGLATVVGVLHSLVVPSSLKLDSAGGFTIPGAETAPASTPDDANAPATAPGESSVAQAPAGSRTSEVGDDADRGNKIGLAQAFELFDLAMVGEPVIFLDARLETDYERGHISGALSMPFTRLGTDDGINEILTFATPGDGTLFVIYCTGGDCEASEDTAIRLQDLGFSNFAIMADGYDDWAAAGHPISGGGNGP